MLTRAILGTVPGAKIRTFVAVGDSQTANSGYSDAIITDLAALGIAGSKICQSSRTLGVPADRFLGSSGSNTGNCVWGHAQEILDAKPDLLSLWIGHNDFLAFGGIEATYYREVCELFSFLKAMLPGLKVVWIIPTHAGTAFASQAQMNSFIDALRPLIRAGINTGYFDAFADFCAQPDLVDNLDANLSDGLHVATATSATKLRDVLRAALDGLINRQTGNVGGSLSLGNNLTNVGLSATETFDVVVAGLGPGQSLNGAVVSGGSIKQGFGSYGSSLGANALFNGDVIRAQTTSSSANSTTTTLTVTEQPGQTASVTMTTVSPSLRSPTTQWLASSQSHPTWISVSNAGKTAAEVVGDIGGSSYIHAQQYPISGRANYYEIHIDSTSGASDPIVALTTAAMDPLFVSRPGTSGVPGISYGSTGAVFANGAQLVVPGSNALYPTFGAGDTIGVGTLDNGDGTTSFWFLDNTGAPVPASSTPFVSGGIVVSGSSFYPALGLRNADTATLIAVQPFAHLSSSQLTAVSAHALDEA